MPRPNTPTTEEEEFSSDMEEAPVRETSEEDSDMEDGDWVLTRGWLRNYQNLERNGLAPVWVNGAGYPHHEIPEEILEWLGAEGNPRANMIGPLRSLAWLAGLDDLIDAIDSPAYTITDCIEIWPIGVGIMHPFLRHIEEGTIIEHIADRILATNLSPRTSFPTPRTQYAKTGAQIPTGLSETPAAFQLSSFTAFSRWGGSSHEVLGMKTTFEKARDRAGLTAAKIRKQAVGQLESHHLWFRGLSLSALESTLAFFVPAITASNRDTEFGPGTYATDSLEYCLNYVRGGGAIMVFKSPDLRGQTVWQPNLADWISLVSKWTQIPNAAASQETLQYRGSDFIMGPIRASQAAQARRGSANRNLAPRQSDDKQLVATSYRGLQALANSLFMIIFVAAGPP